MSSIIAEKIEGWVGKINRQARVNEEIEVERCAMVYRRPDWGLMVCHARERLRLVASLNIDNIVPYYLWFEPAAGVVSRG